MLYHGSKAGAFDLKKIVMECLTSMRRAGKAMRKRTQQLPTMLEVVQCCIRLQVAKSLSGFKLCAATPDNTLQHAIGCANGRKV